MQARSIEVAKKYGIKINVRSTFSKEDGTLILGKEKEMENVVIRGIAFDKNQVKISIFKLLDEPRDSGRLFEYFTEADINIDMIVQSTAENGKNNISFTINNDDLEKSKKIINSLILKKFHLMKILQKYQ